MSDFAIPDPPSEPPEAVQAWCKAWRHRFSKYGLRDHKDRLPIVHCAVRKHRALRNEEEQETGTIVSDTDYLEAMDQWIAMLDDHEGLKASNKEETEALRQAHKA